jgi:hypothetical protein
VFGLLQLCGADFSHEGERLVLTLACDGECAGLDDGVGGEGEAHVDLHAAWHCLCGGVLLQCRECDGELVAADEECTETVGGGAEALLQLRCEERRGRGG